MESKTIIFDFDGTIADTTKVVEWSFIPIPLTT